jgi:hypothetical protein
MWDLSQSSIRNRCEIKKIFFLFLWAQPEENLMWTIWRWLTAFASYSNVILKYSLTQHIYKISRLLVSALLTRHCRTFVFIKSRPVKTNPFILDWVLIPLQYASKILWNKYKSIYIYLYIIWWWFISKAATNNLENLYEYCVRLCTLIEHSMWTSLTMYI